MLDLAYLRDNLETARERLAHRGFSLDVETFQRLDSERKQLILEVEKLRQSQNTASEEIARRKKAKEDASVPLTEMKAVSQRVKEIEVSLRAAEDGLFQFSTVIPNLPDPDVPVGPGEAENVEVRRSDEPRKYDFEPKAHWDLCPPLGILDMERGGKITGSRFYYLAGAGARLERALINFMLDIQTREHGYTEIMPPLMVNRQSLFGTGQLPKFEEDLFWLKNPDYGLIPTAEVPVTNLYRDEILDNGRLPIKFVAYTPCFRSEAGSYGKDVRGIFRVHQFNKVELVKFSRPEDSNDELEKLTRDAETILQRLGLPYRVVIHSTGDMGFGACKSYDIEVWLPGQNTYREISSCSNFGDFQARRANIKYRPAVGGKTKFVHTLNGSGLAVGRTWIAVAENFQQKDGTITVPEALRPYLDGLDSIRPNPVL
jgi:seryl-tRNA synthetase